MENSVNVTWAPEVPRRPESYQAYYCAKRVLLSNPETRHLVEDLNPNAVVFEAEQSPPELGAHHCIEFLRPGDIEIVVFINNYSSDFTIVELEIVDLEEPTELRVLVRGVTGLVHFMRANNLGEFVFEKRFSTPLNDIVLNSQTPFGEDQVKALASSCGEHKGIEAAMSAIPKLHMWAFS